MDLLEDLLDLKFIDFQRSWILYNTINCGIMNMLGSVDIKLLSGMQF